MADDLWSPEPAVEPVAEIETPPATEVTGEPEEATPPVVKEEPKPDVEGIKAAMMAERRQRQVLEARLAEKEEAEKPWIDEDVAARIQEAENKSAMLIENTKIAMSEEFAMEKFADYEDKITVFRELAAEYPQLVNEMRQSANPAAFAYKTAVNHLKMAEMADPEAYEKNLKDRLTAEIEAKYKKQYEAEAAKRGDLPGSLAGTRGVAGTHSATWAGPTSLSDILK